MISTIILRDIEDVRANLLPLTFTRPVALLRVGILTLREKWERRITARYLYETAGYLAEKFESATPGQSASSDTVTVSSHFVADDSLAEAVRGLRPGQRLLSPEGEVMAVRGNDNAAESCDDITYTRPTTQITRVYHIFSLNGRCLEQDFELITAGRESAPLSPTVTVVGDRSRVFLEEGAKVECAVLNVNNGPVYVGHDAEIMEGVLVRGGLAMCRHSVINMGAKIYGATTLGPYCKVGGEVNNVVMIGYSNKGHDGFLGNAVIGEWCNLGAGTNASNLKNDYTQVKLWNYPARRFMPTGLQFCGLIMGDHSKTGINTMLNTATVFGVGVNFHGSGYPRNFTASFSEGSTAGMSDVQLPKFFGIAERMMARRGVALTDVDRHIFEEIFRLAETYK